jgi:hypothetical protein
LNRLTSSLHLARLFSKSRRLEPNVAELRRTQKLCPLTVDTMVGLLETLCRCGVNSRTSAQTVRELINPASEDSKVEDGKASIRVS